jgi:hypothetical protein
VTTVTEHRVLVDGPMAAAWTGRPESTLRRWVHEHRITRYGTPGRAMYDLGELPARMVGGVPPRRHEPYCWWGECWCSGEYDPRLPDPPR